MEKITKSEYDSRKNDLKDSINRYRKDYRKLKIKQVGLISLSVFSKIMFFAGMLASFSIYTQIVEALPKLVMLGIGMSGLATSIGGFVASKKLEFPIEKATKNLAYPEEWLDNAKYSYRSFIKNHEISEEKSIDNDFKKSIIKEQTGTEKQTEQNNQKFSTKREIKNAAISEDFNNSKDFTQ